jgi:hypothetical protein
MGLTNRRRSGYRKKDLLFGTWTVRTQFIPQHNTSRNTKNQMGGCCAEGCITDFRDMRIEVKSRKQG